MIEINSNFRGRRNISSYSSGRYRKRWSPSLSSLSNTANFHWLSILYMVACMHILLLTILAVLSCQQFFFPIMNSSRNLTHVFQGMKGIKESGGEGGGRGDWDGEYIQPLPSPSSCVALGKSLGHSESPFPWREKGMTVDEMADYLPSEPLGKPGIFFSYHPTPLFMGFSRQENWEMPRTEPGLRRDYPVLSMATENSSKVVRRNDTIQPPCPLSSPSPPGKIEEAVNAFEELVRKYPQSPGARYGKAQCEDDLAEKRRSNEILRRAIETYQEAASLPDAPTDLVKLSLKRRSDRQQFLGHMRGSLLTLQKLVQLFPDDTSLKNDLGVGYLLIGDNDSAKKVYEEVLSVTPNDGFAKVHYGFILKAQNKIAESIPYLKEGIESGDPGTDDGRFYFHLGDAMQRVGNKEAYRWYELGHQRGHFASVWQRSLYNVQGLKAQPWWTAKETGYTELVKSLERNWKLIRDEGLAAMDKTQGLFLPEDENLREKGDWSQFTLWQQGRKNENACKGAPKTCSLLDKFPETTGCRRGQIKYSIMHPGTHVWPHTGPTNCRLRMHLGLVIPKEGCKIRCANETRSWEEGKVLIFDDSFEHEVWQDAASFRLIFIVDVWHPELTPHQRRSLPAI
ncbi:hypothetical protein FD755_016499 [Muntiacus reevesi]|uniref:Aspartyl/asparaginy/proline hydroxylase domain-containing protein n=1 Tax=Muntiacus reevesi TaxID=9886 RepID=A0A5N3XCV2_MUNRE|nr:hypothetical protein FD755_016499 [Muntiacus reevesi]